jgi:putative hydrolase of the HAD superfamily
VKHIRTILFDLDDTLWDTFPVLKRAERRMYAWLATNYPRIVEMFPPEKMWEIRKQVVDDHPDMTHNLTFLRRTVLAHMGDAAGYGDDYVEGAFEVFDDARNDLELFPEVRPALESLRDRFVLIAVTNGNARLDKIGVDDLFSSIVYAEEVGAAKPDARVFDSAVAAGGAGKHETLHVGDHPLHDVDGARRAGLDAVWVNRNGNEWPADLEAPDRVIRHVGELEAIFDG